MQYTITEPVTERFDLEGTFNPLPMAPVQLQAFTLLNSIREVHLNQVEKHIKTRLLYIAGYFKVYENSCHLLP